MTDSRMLDRLGLTPMNVSTVEEEHALDLGAFGWQRGSRDRAAMLELRKKDGRIHAIGYGWLERIDYDPSVGIVLHLVGQRITVRGRNLNAETRPHVRLFEGLTRHRVTWLAEADQATMLTAPAGSTVIEEITLA